MNDNTSPPTEAITLFRDEPSANGTASAERQQVEHLTGRLGLGRAQLSAVHGVMTWAVFLRPSTDPADRECRRPYLDVMGYLPADRRTVAHAERSRGGVDAAVPALLEGFAGGELDPEAFLETDAGLLAQRFAGVTRSQV